MRDAREIECFLDKTIEDYLLAQAIPGLSLGIVLDGELAVKKSFGVKNAEEQDAIDANTLFHSASISKTFVVTALMQLQEKGMLDISKTVCEYLPYFKLKDDRYRYITIRQMMSHISGMPDVYDYEWENPDIGEDALENYIRSTYDIELLWEPGDCFSYSNLAYEVLGDVIAKVSGMSFEAYMKKHILLPLGMRDSSFLIHEVPKEKMTSPHVVELEGGYKAKVNEFYPYNRIHAPSSTLWSSVEELSKYAIANLNEGLFEGFRMLTQKSYDAMWQPYAVTNKAQTQIGLSWFLKKYKDTDLVFHTGGDTGYTSNLVLLPKHRAAMVLYCNCDYINLMLVTELILDIMLGFEVNKPKKSVVPELVQRLSNEGIEAAINAFEHLREDKEYYIDEGDLNKLAYQYFNKGKVDEGIDVIKLAIRELPHTANLFDSLGEMYVKKGELALGVEAYKKALMLDAAMSSSIEALKRLQMEV